MCIEFEFLNCISKIIKKTFAVLFFYLKIPSDCVNERVGFRDAADVDGVAGPNQTLVNRVHDLEGNSRCN